MTPDLEAVTRTREVLRETLAQWLYDEGWTEPDGWADALLAGPLADLSDRLAEAEAKVRAVEDVCAEREAEMGDLLLPDLRALIRDVRAALSGGDAT